MKCAVGSVVYKEAEEYLYDFFGSLLKQNSHDFDIILLNDNYKLSEINKKVSDYFGEYKNQITIINSSTETNEPFQLRIRLMEEIKRRNYDLLIFADCDDCLSENRVECIQKSYDKKYTFYYNEIKDFQGNYVMPVMPDNTTSIMNVGEQNYLGLSNTAVNLNYLSEEFIKSLYEGQTLIFDWYLFSRILLNGAIGTKVNNCYTFYRLHDNNIAGKTSEGNKALEKEIKVKLQHYNLLAKHHPYYKGLLEKYKNISIDSLKYNEDAIDVYWWGMIKEEKNK